MPAADLSGFIAQGISSQLATLNSLRDICFARVTNIPLSLWYCLNFKWSALYVVLVSYFSLSLEYLLLYLILSVPPMSEFV